MVYKEALLGFSVKKILVFDFFRIKLTLYVAFFRIKLFL